MNYALDLSDDFLFPVARSVPRWSGFPGNPDHPSPPFSPDDRGTIVLCNFYSIYRPIYI